MFSHSHSRGHSRRPPNPLTTQPALRWPTGVQLPFLLGLLLDLPPSVHFGEWENKFYMNTTVSIRPGMATFLHPLPPKTLSDRRLGVGAGSRRCSVVVGPGVEDVCRLLLWTLECAHLLCLSFCGLIATSQSH